MLILKHLIECPIKSSKCPKCESQDILMAESESAQEFKNNSLGATFKPKIYFPVKCKTCDFDITSCDVCSDKAYMSFKQEIHSVSADTVTVLADQLTLDKKLSFEPTDPSLMKKQLVDQTKTAIACQKCGTSKEPYILECMKSNFN